MTDTFWICAGIPPKTPACGERGQYVHKAQTGDSGPAYQHLRDTGHTVITAGSDWVWGREAA